MADETKKPGATPATTPKGNAGTELDDAALDRVSGGFLTIKLTDVVVSSNNQGSTGSGPVETNTNK